MTDQTAAPQRTWVAKRPEPVRRLLRLCAILLTLGVLGVSLGLVFSPDRAMIFPARIAGALPPPPPDVEVILTEGGVVWLLEGQGEAPAPVVFLFHGNGENIASMLGIARQYRSRGLAVALVEYPGYGGTPGTPTQRSITQASVAAYDMITSRDDVDPRRVLVHGFSLGGAAAAQLANERRVDAMILESTFVSLVAMYREMGLPGFLCRDPFRTDLVLESFEGPVLLVHGRRDEIVPFEHAVRLEAIASDGSLLAMDGNHNDGPSDVRAYWEAIDGLLGSMAGASSAAEPPRSGDGPR